MTDGVLARLVALKTMPMPVLKEEWRALFDREAPPYNGHSLKAGSHTAFRNSSMADLSRRRFGGLKRSANSSTAGTASSIA